MLKFDDLPKRHIAVLGKTQSGKTQFSIKLYRDFPGISIFFNSQSIPNLRPISDITISSIEELREAIDFGARKINFIPSENHVLARGQLIQIKRIIFNIGKTICADREDIIWCRLFVDEVQNLVSKMESDPDLQALWKSSLRWGIEVIAISQRPAEVWLGVLAESDHHFIFMLKDYDLPYFKRYNIPIEEAKEWLSTPYHFLFYDGVNPIIRMNPIKMQ